MRGEIMKGEVCFKGMSQNPPLYTTITVTIGAEGTGAILMATGVGAPFALILSVAGVVTGAVSLIGNYFNKKATTKAEKHLKI